MTRILTFLVLVVICGLCEFPISAVVLGVRKMPLDMSELIRHGVLVVYGISLFASSCYTLIKEHRPIGRRLTLFTVICILALSGGVMCYAIEFSDAIKEKRTFVLSDFSIVIQYVCASVALLFALVLEFKRAPGEAPPGYSYLRLH